MKKGLNKSLLLLLIAILSLSIIPLKMATGVSSEPHAADSMWIEPSSVTYSPGTPIGTKFNITAWLNITSDNVFGWQFGLLYNRTQLRGVRGKFTLASTSEFMQGHEVQTSGPTIDTSFLGNGSVVAFESCKGDDFVQTPCAGSLVWIEFEIVNVPPEGQTFTSKFDITTNYPDRTWVQNPDLSKLALTTYDGTYTYTGGAPPPMFTLTITATSGGTTNPAPGPHTYASGTSASVSAIPDPSYLFDHWELDTINIGATNPVNVTMNTNHTLHTVFVSAPPTGTKLYVDPHEIIDPTMVPCSTFSVNITIDDVTNMKTCLFNMSYNPQVLSIIGYSLFKVQNQYPISKVTQDSEAGFIWVSVKYSTPITTDIPTALVKIEFHVEAIGMTPLDLHDTNLTDPAGQPISHDAIDGFFATFIRDIAITNVVANRTWVYQSKMVEINVTVINKGTINETFNVSTYYDSNFIGNLTVVDLPPSNETLLRFIWNTTTATPCHNYTISAKADILPYEINITDNTYIDGKVKVRIYGDITGDGWVDGSDMAIAAAAFGSYPGHPRWNPIADLTEDSRVDGLDLLIIAKNFGKACSP